MRCIHPRHKVIYDAYSGELREITFPCGHCAACIHNQADSWAIRLQETAAHCDGFIYDTLTLRDDVLQWIDVSDAFLNGFVELTDELSHFLFDSGYKHTAYSSSLWESRLPYLDKHVVSDWLKRGRDNYFKFHHKRCDLRYFCLLEYGPKWSRPHVHLVAFGVNYADWVRFWAKPWRVDFGFTSTHYIRRGQKNSQRSRECISRYIVKYINKGSFEVPTVKAGLLPRAWRVISHGIGKEYLNSSRFDWIKIPKFQSYKAETAFHLSPVVKPRLHNGKWVLWKYYRKVERLHPSRVVGFSLTRDEISSLTSYSDEHGFMHALPRYYKECLLGRSPNLLKYEIQNSLLADACQRRDKEISRIAANLKCGQTCGVSSPSDLVSLLGRGRYLASYLFDVIQENQARLDEQRCFDKLNNHFNRIKRYNPSTSSFNRNLIC